MAAVKALQQWCRIQCDGYRDVSITNMTTSFRDGLAFCALIHKHRPDLIDFDSLKKENVFENNKLAFRVAEDELGIPALLDAEDMVAMKVPDRLSILTYVSQYYNYFHGRSPIGGMGGMKRPAEASTDEPSGKKNQPVVAKVFPSSKPARENSPPPSSNIARPSPSPKQTRSNTTDVPVYRPHQTGTLSNKCVSCNKHVHLVQRHLVDGKLYHRNCAKSLSPTNSTTPLRDLPTNTPVSKFTPLPDSSKHITTPPTKTPSRLGPTWLTEKPSIPSSITTTTTTSSPSFPTRPASNVSSTAKESRALPVSRPTSSRTTCESTFTTTPSVNTRPTPAPRTSLTAAKTMQDKLRFFQTDSDPGTKQEEQKKTTVISVDVNKGTKKSGQVQEATAGQAVTVVLNVGGAGKKGTSPNLGKGRDGAKAVAPGGKVSVTPGDSGNNMSKASAAAFISKKLSEGNSDNSTKPSWTSVTLKKTEPPSEVQPPKKETAGVRGRVKLRADPSLLADLPPPDTATSPPSPASRTGLRARTPDRGSPRPARTASPSTTAASESESPADWRTRLKPVGKETKHTVPPQPTKPTSVASSNGSTPSISITPPPSKALQNGPEEQTANGTKSESKTSKIRPDHIPREDIIKELQEIEDNLNELEKRGVELEMRLRRSEEAGEDDSLMDELMVDWFNLIRNKQVAMRRESELVYIGRTQDLEEQQPTVEEELRRLMDKPEHLKTAWERRKEEQLMEKLVSIVNDRNAIVEGLDEDRLREEEEDEQLNKMMLNFNVKKDKPKKKISKLFSWGNKKEG